MKCLKRCTIKIKGHVRGVRGVKHCTVLPIKDQRLYVRGVESGVCGFYTTVYTE